MCSAYWLIAGVYSRVGRWEFAVLAAAETARPGWPSHRNPAQVKHPGLPRYLRNSASGEVQLTAPCFEQPQSHRACCVPAFPHARTNGLEYSTSSPSATAYLHYPLSPPKSAHPKRKGTFPPFFRPSKAMLVWHPSLHVSLQSRQSCLNTPPQGNSRLHGIVWSLS